MVLKSVICDGAGSKQRSKKERGVKCREEGRKGRLDLELNFDGAFNR